MAKKCDSCLVSVGGLGYNNFIDQWGNASIFTSFSHPFGRI